MNKRIAIIGGGPRQMNGATVTVFERDASQDSRDQGATLDLHHDSGSKALEQAHLMDEFRANYHGETSIADLVIGADGANSRIRQADPKFIARPQYYCPLDQTWDALQL